ncbi:MAG: CPBP family glutamic-type intramembrane protease [Candidatus Hodarchaeales archaeon]|jgi:membrane protease YdiL (CAAX protease family)
MRKIEIVEIENNLLNFFTPAVITAAGFFLWNLFAWPLHLIELDILQIPLGIESYLLDAIIINCSGFLVFLIAFFVFIPRLNVLDADYKEINKSSFIIVLLVFCFAMCYRFLLTVLFDSLGIELFDAMPEFVFSFDLFYDPLFLFFFIIYFVLVTPLFTEIIYRRTVIPLLEDRGLSPFQAVIFSSFGFCLFHLPRFVTNPNFQANMYWFISTFIFGFATGVIYMYTRNIVFPLIYSIIYFSYRLTYTFSIAFDDLFYSLIHNILNFGVLIVGLAVTGYIVWSFIQKPNPEWIKVIKKPSVPQVGRGVVGFLIISSILVGLQILIPNLIDNSFDNNNPVNILLNSIFYLLVFSIPFWLTITSEYAQY